MAMIDRVFRTVESTINSERRGKLTPQEFNAFAHQAQNRIIDQYFHDYNLYENARKAGRTNTEYADIPKLFRERINLLSKVGVADYDSATEVFTVPLDLYRLTTVRIGGNYAQEEEFDQILFSEASPKGRSNAKRPVYTRLGNNLRVYNGSTDVSALSVLVDYIKKPSIPKWTYITVEGVAQFEDTRNDYQDFEVHPADEHELVNEILIYAGITIRESDLATLAAEKDVLDSTNEKTTTDGIKTRR